MAQSSDLQLPEGWQDLVRASRDVRENAYARYSEFRVGAAVRTQSGQIFRGCNVENASYGLTICAERTAVSTAVASGDRQLSVMCISLEGVPTPCGACRQFLFEFNPELTLLLDDVRLSNPAPECTTLSTLLPRGFQL